MIRRTGKPVRLFLSLFFCYFILPSWVEKFYLFTWKTVGLKDLRSLYNGGIL
jgi:hypothetical protein